MSLDAEAILDQRKVGIVLAEQLMQVAVVLEGNDDALIGRLRLGRTAAAEGLPPKSCQIMLSE